eukprot:TRINITY_DN1494_c0_g1_i4.p2 TRINITY_DN1494_c0_g1~~TRINITY_DN1494_c0_g1_i4.p2  ORF type:complete len:140 (+),score=25.90 TRINITY_DN1494_c0_g1_i4:330-749(+)
MLRPSRTSSSGHRWAHWSSARPRCRPSSPTFGRRWAHAFKCTAWKLLESPKDPSGARIEVMYGGESFDVRENVRKLIESIGYIGLDTYGVEYCRHVEALLDLSVTMLSAGEGLQNVKSWGYYWAFTSKRFEQQSGRVEP